MRTRVFRSLLFVFPAIALILGLAVTTGAQTVAPGYPVDLTRDQSQTTRPTPASTRSSGEPGTDISTRAKESWKPAHGPLMTSWAADVSPSNALPEYPRRQMVRQRWQNLNGLWDYVVTPKDNVAAPAKYDGQILVPYPIESALSGVMKPFLPTQKLWYHRTFNVPESWIGDQRLLLHFGAVDWETEVWVDGKSLGRHLGGYDAFTFDLSRIVTKAGPHDLVVAVLDPTRSGWQMLGKQNLHPSGASYTATSGIWQTVWIEPVPQSSVDKVTLTPDLKGGRLRIAIDARIPPTTPLTVVATAFDAGAPVATTTATVGGELALDDVHDNLVKFYKARLTLTSTDLTLVIPQPKAWSPDSPFLYDLKIELKAASGETIDQVTSYFGLRDVALALDCKGRSRIFLNGHPIVFAGALDQGFWPDGIYTAPTDAALRFDIEAAKTLGLDALRKHVKVEPERWYYWADKLGILVLQDMPSSAAGDPFTDLPASPEATAQLWTEFQRIIDQDFNHPSIIAWVLFNEGWGQHDTVRFVQRARQLDPARLIDEASGFPWHGAGDIADQHGGVARAHRGQAGIDTETCGYGLATPGHDWPGKMWATGTFDPATGHQTKQAFPSLYPLNDPSKKWFTQDMAAFFASVIADGPKLGSSGTCKCQLTDVENECNGLLSYDRAVWKVEPSVIRAALRDARASLNR